MMMYFFSEEPWYMDQQPPEQDPVAKELVEEKLQKVILSVCSKDASLRYFNFYF